MKSNLRRILGKSWIKVRFYGKSLSCSTTQYLNRCNEIYNYFNAAPNDNWFIKLNLVYHESDSRDHS